MLFRNFTILSLSLFLFSSSAFALEPNPANEVLLKQISRGFSNVAKQASPAVVYIESQGHVEQDKKATRKGPYENPFDYFDDDFFNRFFGFNFEQKQPSKNSAVVRGSGFLVSQDGYIVTNNHVVEKAGKVSVTLNNGKKVTATVIGADPKSDLAVIKIDGNGYPTLAFGDSEKLEVGDWAIAIGNPFGLQTSVTVGVVSAKGRNQLHIADFEDFIQTDAAINPGNSGGPLLNVEGDVIGVNTAIVSGSGGYMGIGFAIPSHMAKLIVDQLIKEGQVTRSFLGVTVQEVDGNLGSFYHMKNNQGALVTDVVKGSPADQGGLKQEDIILTYNGIPVENLSVFRNYVSLLTPQSKLKLKVLRDGKEIDINITIAKEPHDAAALKKLGLHVQDLSSDLSKKFGLEENKGIVITRVEPNSPAAEAALKPGVLIMAVNRQKVSTLSELNSVINSATKEGRVLLMVKQGEVIRFVALHFE